MQCPLCGATIQDDAVFCTNCGQKLPEQPAAPAVNEQDEALIGSVRSFIEERRNELNSALQDKAALAADKDNMSQQLGEIQSKNMDLSSQVADLEKQLKEKDKLLADLQAELDKVRQEAEAKAAEATAAAQAPAPAEEPAPAQEAPAAEETAEIEVPESEADQIDQPTEQIPEVEEAPAVPENKICPSCGSVMPPENKFCTNCGTALV